MFEILGVEIYDRGNEIILIYASFLLICDMANFKIKPFCDIIYTDQLGKS